MEFDKYKDLVKSLSIGKRLPDAVYLHKDALSEVPVNLKQLIEKVAAHYTNGFEWAVVKLFTRDHRISLLDYPGFFEESYPVLNASLTIDLVRDSSRVTRYGKSKNPPILHRKESLLFESHAHYSLANSITREGEEVGLYENTKRIGFKANWERLIADKGYSLVDGRLVPLEQASVHNIDDVENVKVQRHRTAINRDRLSSPMQGLARHGFLDGSRSVFDYGCGKGDDLLELEANGIDVAGWDPVYRAEHEKKAADIVNLGFVINVIEDRAERISVLKDAFRFANKMLVVSAMLGRDSQTNLFKPYKDGVITSRDTFQKYYTQAELKEFIESSVSEQAIAVSPGVFFVFKDDLEAQKFLSNRQRVRRTWNYKRSRVTGARKFDTEKIFAENGEILRAFWELCLTLGRLPANDEFEDSAEIRRIIGSHRKAFEIACSHFGNEEFEKAKLGRIDDLLVYLALGFFGRRKAYKKMPVSLQRDIKAFFTNQSTALEVAKKTLFSIANVDVITEACVVAREQLRTGRLDSDHSYTVHRSQIVMLPGILRIYVGCATELYGDIDEVDLVKIHMASGKVSMMIYDDYSKKLPILKERIKIKMREQDIDWFYYDDAQIRQPLYLKSAYMNPDTKHYEQQKEFDSMIASLPGIDLSSFGPSHQELVGLMDNNGLGLEECE